MLEEYFDNISQTIETVRKDLDKLRIAKPSEKNGITKKVTSAINDVRTELELAQGELEASGDVEDRSSLNQQIKSYELEIKELKDTLEVIELNNSSQSTIKTINQAQNISESQAQKMVANKSRNLMKSAKARANNIRQIIDDTNLLANDINDEIREQNARLLEMDELVKEAQSTLNRTNQLVSFFAKAFYRDCCLKIMIVLITIAIVGVAVAAVIRKTSGKKKEEDTPKPTPTPTPTPDDKNKRLLEEHAIRVVRMLVQRATGY